MLRKLFSFRKCIVLISSLNKKKSCCIAILREIILIPYRAKIAFSEQNLFFQSMYASIIFLKKFRVIIIR